jgi:hypothetical protein
MTKEEEEPPQGVVEVTNESAKKGWIILELIIFSTHFINSSCPSSSY